jgi:hypothetical protein
MGGERWVVTLQALPDDWAPGWVRMKRALKMFLRVFGLKAIDLAGDPPLPPDWPQDAAGNGEGQPVAADDFGRHNANTEV